MHVFNPFGSTKEARAEHWKAVFEVVDAEEEKWSARFEKALNDIVDDAARMHAGEGDATELDLVPLRAVYEDLYSEVVIDFATRTFESLEAVAKSRWPDDSHGTIWARGGVKQLDDELLFTWDAIVQSLLRGDGGNRITSVGKTIIDTIIRPILIQADEEGWGPIRAGREMRKKGLELTKAQGDRIARTELVGASNAGQMAGAGSIADRLGLEMRKEWIASLDSRVRDTHAAADGQQVPLDATFTVGAAALQQPGDPSGPAEEVINCRCTIGFEVV